MKSSPTMSLPETFSPKPPSSATTRLSSSLDTAGPMASMRPSSIGSWWWPCQSGQTLRTMSLSWSGEGPVSASPKTLMQMPSTRHGMDSLVRQIWITTVEIVPNQVHKQLCLIKLVSDCKLEVRGTKMLTVILYNIPNQRESIATGNRESARWPLLETNQYCSSIQFANSSTPFPLAADILNAWPQCCAHCT